MGFQESFEGQQWFVVETDTLQIRSAYASRFKTVLSRQFWKTGVLLAARESLLLRRRKDAPVADQASGGVVIEGGNTENMAGHDGRVRLDDVRCGGDNLQLRQATKSQ